MAKYTDEQLKDMARVVIEDNNQGGHRSMMLIMVISSHTGLEPNEVMKRIQYLANK